MKEYYTIWEIARSNLLDHIFLKEKTTPRSKYMRIWKLVKSGELKSIKVGGKTKDYYKIHIKDIRRI
jgi:hypothetical protein